MREADERHDQDIARRHRADLLTSGVCDADLGEHERCRMIGCECPCHARETTADHWRRLLLG